ncbi:hypothetical protein [Bradyrhizobium lablabi]|uniref:hypothetical protein n=1 Tax=Bradyrhizobium lablabi TaxID=722472 RepID=UPI001BAB317F|nr:hypothetical protein [Bradyrhizobium lablabi]MBR0695140.1 hypothetical protein [Bradyrhizobium lablabi]
MHDRSSDSARRRAAKSARKARYRALLKAGGAVLVLHVRDKNALIRALLNRRWLEESESEDWSIVSTRASVMLDEFAERYGGELSPVDRQPEKPVPSSRP